MARTLQSDELNILRTKGYRGWFGEMHLDNYEMLRREDLAEALELVFIYIFSYMSATNALDNPQDFDYLYEVGIWRYFEVLEEANITTTDYPYLSEYVPMVVKEIVDTTAERINEPYMTSTDRVKYISADEANAVGNYTQYIDAIQSGKQYKTWITMLDEKVRHDHRDAEELTVPIEQPFEVGGDLLMYPKDTSLGASLRQIVRCRCTCEYS